MNTCSTCKSWDHKNIKHGTPEIRVGGWCNSSKFREDIDNNCYDPDALVYSYHEDGSFWTGPNFGCVHWRKKD